MPIRSKSVSKRIQEILHRSVFLHFVILSGVKNLCRHSCFQNDSDKKHIAVDAGKAVGAEKSSTLLQSFLPNVRIAPGMEDSQHSHCVASNQVEDAKWKATSQRAANTTVDNLVPFRIALDGCERGFDNEQKLRTKPGQLRFVPIVSFTQIRLGLWTDDQPVFHVRARIRFFTSTQGEPAFGF